MFYFMKQIILNGVAKEKNIRTIDIYIYLYVYCIFCSLRDLFDQLVMETISSCLSIREGFPHFHANKPKRFTLADKNV